MKTSKFFFALLAVLLVAALVACGGGKEPDVTEPPATTTEAPATTTSPITTTAAPVTTTTAAPEAPLDIVFKAGISTALTEAKDANGKKIYKADEIFANTAAFASSETAVWNNTGDSAAKAEASADISLAWDGAFVYAYVEVTDPTMTSKGQAWIDGTANADLFYNDSFEFYYCFGAEPTSKTRKIVKMDAYGLVKFAGDSEKSVFFDEIEATGKYSEELGKYYIVFKIPAKAEDGTALKAGDTVYFSEQINDIRDASDVSTKKVYCSGANRKYDKWVSFKLEDK